MTITTIASAGSLASSDVLVTISPPQKPATITFSITSPVLAQFGQQIKQVALKTLALLKVTACHLQIQDQAAIDLVLTARIVTAYQRATKTNNDKGHEKDENTT